MKKFEHIREFPGTEALIDLWFEEDIREGDHTTLSTIPASARGIANLLVKEPGIIAGVKVAEQVLKHFDPNLSVNIIIDDGDDILPGDIVFSVEGSVRSILQSERLVLNVMQRMSGIATQTHRYVQKIAGTGAQILDTRKTTPGFRYFEKEAVRIGGGVNHRAGLYDMILIKDNHIDFAGGLEKAIQSARKYLSDHQMNLKIEVETRSIGDIMKLLKIGGNRPYHAG